MLDPKFIRDNPDIVKAALKKRGAGADIVDEFLSLDEKRRKVIFEVEDLARRKREASDKIGAMLKEKKNVAAAKADVGKLSKKITDLDSALSDIEKKYKETLDKIPNVPHESVPPGKGAADNSFVREFGGIPKFSFAPKDHIELGKLCGIFDLERAAKMAGSSFIFFTGAGARLERALINFMLDVHTKEHGYTEVFPPFLVNRKAMRGTGQLPKLEEDMYRLELDDFFLIPTAEVPVTNFFADEVIPEEKLPVCFTAYSACFRREAGSYGKDTRGIIRVHQFDKVELVKFTTPETSMEELEKLLADAEDILKRLGLPYRVMKLCAAEMSFSAHMCYDIELWAPGTKKWLEVSSCSVFTDFQARRANIKYQPKVKTQKARFVHTLNGSGVALPRLLMALLEIYQRGDGSVGVPPALVPYFGAKEIKPTRFA